MAIGDLVMMMMAGEFLDSGPLTDLTNGEEVVHQEVGQPGEAEQTPIENEVILRMSGKQLAAVVGLIMIMKTLGGAHLMKGSRNGVMTIMMISQLLAPLILQARLCLSKTMRTAKVKMRENMKKIKKIERKI